MKNRLTLIKAIFFSVSYLAAMNTAFSQCKDLIRNTGTGLYDVHVFSDGEIIACGVYGHIIKSKDGGSTWTSINSTNIFYSIRNMSFPSDSIGFAVGSFSNCILKTEDKGDTWIPLYGLKGSAGYGYSDVSFINNEIGFVTSFDGYLLKTVDGGRNWIETYYNSEWFTSIYFKNDSTGYITGPSGFILNTSDSGKTWNQVAYNGGRLNKITFVNNAVGYAVGESGTVVKTNNGGISWAKQTNFSGAYLTDVLFLNENVGFALGDYNTGLIIKTTDGGVSWNLLDPGFTGSLTSIDFDRINNKLMVVGSQGLGSSGEGRYILTSKDEGISWIRESSNYSHNFHLSQYLNDSTVFLAEEDGKVYKSKDKGESWKELGFASKYITNAIFFINESKGFLFNDKNRNSNDEMYETNDGGNTWDRNPLPDTIGYGSSGHRIFFWDTMVGLAVKSNGIFKTIDGGRNWTEKAHYSTSNDHGPFEDVSCQSNGKCYAITLYGRLFQSNNYGETWDQTEMNNVDEFFQTVYTVNDSIAFIGANSGLIYKTLDGGQTWVKSSSGIDRWNVVGFYFINASTGYASCNNNGGTGAIYQTSDTGKVWSLILQASETHQISGLNKDFIIAGGYGTILKSYTESPPVTGYIAGPVKACLHDKQVYSTVLLDSNNYQWSLSGGGSSSIFKNVDSILWTVPGQHTLSLTTANSCGTGVQRQIVVDVAAFEPVITQSDTVLTATEGVSYQWFRNGIRIPASAGGTSRSIAVKQAGRFTVEVKSIYGCSRTTSPFTYNAPELCHNGSTTLTANLTGTTYQWQLNKGTGFENISNDFYYAGVNTDSLKLLYAPSNWYGYQYRCLVDGVYSDITTLKFSNTWVGTHSSSWEYSYNWLCGSVPNGNTDVVIHSGTVVINSNVSCRSITIHPGAQLKINPGYQLTITH